uniref:Uncharacterized protein n=1 Tax=Globisporangium ultimum (strain ATCC 200006 / CBS 805.95 / DAOM BR144) TaxID=431595 RepID=K3XBP3_GLOUD
MVAADSSRRRASSGSSTRSTTLVTMTCLWPTAAVGT